jgi:hypothetical protein
LWRRWQITAQAGKDLQRQLDAVDKVDIVAQLSVLLEKVAQVIETTQPVVETHFGWPRSSSSSSFFLTIKD